MLSVILGKTPKFLKPSFASGNGVCSPCEAVVVTHLLLCSYPLLGVTPPPPQFSVLVKVGIFLHVFNSRTFLPDELA